MKKLNNAHDQKSGGIVVTEKLLIAKFSNDFIVCYAPVVALLCKDRIVCDMSTKNHGTDTLQYFEAFSEAAKLILENKAGLYYANFNVDVEGNVGIEGIKWADGNEKIPSNSARDELRYLLDLETDTDRPESKRLGNGFTIIEPRAARKYALETAAALLGDPKYWNEKPRISNPMNEHQLRSELYTGIAIEYLLELRRKGRKMDISDWITKLAI